MKNNNETKQAGIKVSFTFLVIFRLALLAGPLTAICLKLSHAPLACAALGLAWLGLWLSVDVWPFRAESATPVKAQATATVTAGMGRRAAFSGMNKTQWWSALFCSVVLFLMMVRSRMHI